MLSDFMPVVLAADEAERGVAHAEEAAVARIAPPPIAGLVHQAHVGRHRRVDVPLELARPTPRSPASRRAAAARCFLRPVMHW